jgi:hypothetical protein
MVIVLCNVIAMSINRVGGIAFRFVSVFLIKIFIQSSAFIAGFTEKNKNRKPANSYFEVLEKY